MEDPEEEIDEQTYAALRRADEQIARGEVRAWEDVSTDLWNRYAAR